jgi:HAD superfamily phosphoserine phosphatase-like hydrolase
VSGEGALRGGEEEVDTGPSRWVVVTDFDGTLTVDDVGNAICAEVLGQRFHELLRRYRSGELDLRALQRLVWERLPLPEGLLRAKAAAVAVLRPGVQGFLERCARSGAPVFVASCGVRAYIEAVLDARLSPAARAAIRGIRCNEALFDAQGLRELLPPDPVVAGCPYPVDKGATCDELRRRFPGRSVLGIGNGTADRSFVGHVDLLAATDALADHCRRQGHRFLYFESFTDLLHEPAL